MIPKDPIILLSFLNTKLRDYYSSLDDMCESMDLKKEDVTSKMEQIGYQYNEQTNQFQ